MEIVDPNPKILKKLDEKLLDEGGRIRLYPSAFYSTLPRDQFRAWCTKRARYQIPTIELVQWLKDFIGARSAIEIGSGNGDLYWHLGIPGTDNYCQEFPEVLLQYRMMRQVPTKPPSDVIRLDAIEAIKQLQPEVVIGAWITQKHLPDSPDGNMYGPREESIIRQCTYVHIGNKAVHGSKRILKFEHQVIQAPWLVSKASQPPGNCIYIWQKP
jgi:hypothetical protein